MSIYLKIREYIKEERFKNYRRDIKEILEKNTQNILTEKYRGGVKL